MKTEKRCSEAVAREEQKESWRIRRTHLFDYTRNNQRRGLSLAIRSELEDGSFKAEEDFPDVS